MMEGDGVLSAHQGKDVHLECKANGDDPMSIMWRREGREHFAEQGRSSITVIRELQHVTSKIAIEKTQKMVVDMNARLQFHLESHIIIFIFKYLSVESQQIHQNTLQL